MDIDFLKDKFAGCLLGLAIGDAMGAPVEGMTPYQVISKFGYVDGFFPQSNRGLPSGKYTAQTLSAIYMAKAMIRANGVFDQAEASKAMGELESKHPQGVDVGRTMLAKAVPVGMLAAATGMDGQELANACRSLAPPGSKRNALAMFLTASAIREIIRNHAELSKPHELYDADRSLLARLASMAMKSEAKFEDDDAERLGPRLDFARRKLMTNWDLPRFIGTNGIGGDAAETVAIAIFSWLRAPDEFSTICNTVSMGGPASMNGALVGALVGATMGASLMPSDMKDQAENGPKIESLAIAFAEKCMPRQGTGPESDKSKE